jgi:hypothetical protein
MDGWVKALPAILAYGVLGGLLMLATGHVIGNSSIHVSRAEGPLLTLFALVGALVSAQLGRRPLTVSDPVALLVFVFCIFWQAAKPQLVFPVLGVALSFLLLAWAIDYMRGRQSPTHTRTNS